MNRVSNSVWRAIACVLVLFCAFGALVIYAHTHLGAAFLALAAMMLIAALLPDVQGSLRFIGGSSPWTVSILTLIAVGFLLIGLSRIGVDNDSFVAQGLAVSEAGASGAVLPAPTVAPITAAPTATATTLPKATATAVATATPTPVGPVYLAIGDMTSEEIQYWADYVQNFDFCQGRFGNPGGVHGTLAIAIQDREATMKATDPKVETSWVGKREKDGRISLVCMLQGSNHFERFSFSIEPVRHRIMGADQPARDLLLQLRRGCR